jgi:hypothetical protein
MRAVQASSRDGVMRNTMTSKVSRHSFSTRPMEVEKIEWAAKNREMNPIRIFPGLR